MKSPNDPIGPNVAVFFSIAKTEGIRRKNMNNKNLAFRNFLLNMINKIKKFIFFSFLLSGLILLFLLSLYGFLVYKPGQTIKFIDKAFIFEYSVDIESIESNRNFINPVFVNKEIKIKDNKKNELIYIPNLKIGINLFKSLFKKSISLSLLEIDTFISKYSSSGTTTEPFLINGIN